MSTEDHSSVVLRDRRSHSDLQGKVIEKVLVQPSEVNVPGQTHISQLQATHLVSPRCLPRELCCHCQRPRHVVIVCSCPRLEMRPLSACSNQIDIGDDCAGHETPRDERPGVGARQVGQARRCAAPHPDGHVFETLREWEGHRKTPPHA